MYVRSNSDISEINVLVRNNYIDGYVVEVYFFIGESFFVIIRKFE